LLCALQRKALNLRIKILKEKDTKGGVKPYKKKEKEIKTLSIKIELVTF
jgi:hypothetical protein